MENQSITAKTIENNSELTLNMPDVSYMRTGYNERQIKAIFYQSSTDCVLEVAEAGKTFVIQTHMKYTSSINRTTDLSTMVSIVRTKLSYGTWYEVLNTLQFNDKKVVLLQNSNNGQVILPV